MNRKKIKLLTSLMGAACLASFSLGVASNFIKPVDADDLLNQPSDTDIVDINTDTIVSEDVGVDLPEEVGSTERPSADVSEEDIESPNEKPTDSNKNNTTDKNNNSSDKTTSSNNNSNIKPSNINYVMLVNRQNTISKNFVPSNLRTLNIPFVGAANSNKMDSYAGAALERMFSDAKADGVILQGRSGYRSYNTQKINYENKVASVGQTQADKYVAKPGASEHQTGLAMDIVTKGYNKLDSGFKNTKAYSWLIKNCANYGFILRYPEGKSHITGYNFEPWHYRYVGVEHAKIIMKNNLTLEEYYSKYLGQSAGTADKKPASSTPEVSKPSQDTTIESSKPSTPSTKPDSNPIVPEESTDKNDSQVATPPSSEDSTNTPDIDSTVPAIPPDLTDNPNHIIDGIEDIPSVG